MNNKLIRLNSLTRRTFYSFVLSALMFPVLASANDFYVITATYKTQLEAQNDAAAYGGWVLNTNFYNKLTPGLYAVVRGPFKSGSDAQGELSSLQHFSHWMHGYVKDAGDINIEIKIGNKKLSPQMLAALLGELRIDISDNEGATNPCEPQEPYLSLSLSYVTLQRSLDSEGNETDQLKEMPIDIGGLWQLKRSGEIERMRICTE
jgi:hypothetical protein